MVSDQTTQPDTAARLAATLGLPLDELVVAPMVDQSELAFRMLCRRYGATLCYTPMLHARLFLDSARYRQAKFTTCPADRPLIVQFCGNDPDTLLEAARHVEAHCDAVDLNLGCPQHIARRGHYGAFLLEEADLLATIVDRLARNLCVPVTCKIRLLPSIDRTLALARRLESAGCALLTVHGRTRQQKKEQVGTCDWDAIRRVTQAVSIPVIANGGVGSVAEARACREATGATAVMSAEAILENPALVAGRTPLPQPTAIALAYLDLVALYPDTPKVVRAHLFKFLHGMLSAHPRARRHVAASPERRGLPALIDYLRKATLALERLHTPGPDGQAPACTLPCCRTQPPGAYSPWYDRHRKANPTLQALYQEPPETGDSPAAYFPISQRLPSRADVLQARIARKAARAARRAAPPVSHTPAGSRSRT